MRLSTILRGGIVVACTAFASGTALAEDLAFTLKNATGVAVTEFYLSPSNVNNWEENLLGNDTLSAGDSIQVTVADGRATCVYDIKTVFKDGSNVDDRAINLCELGSYTVHE
ncbi:hypothetical protein [Zavarzinia compransoris]|uniref:Argininosuccinate lyase n=1 Tax=Zavarzinia compransoris TaxID=1264899 RepID=A0A317E9Q7_9PROT|nr:hypothetical protein [Zavarzinia compransoris]PWR23848.1 hypothetical protein DKG75_04625 [Zavarzinia compransoris]TDP48084.1 hypothetical protein DES42_102381 [Zavarzinia compransoris]